MKLISLDLQVHVYTAEDGQKEIFVVGMMSDRGSLSDCRRENGGSRARLGQLFSEITKNFVKPNQSRTDMWFYDNDAGPER